MADVTRPKVLGVEINPVTLAEAVATVLRWLDEPSDEPKLVFTPNPEMLVYAHRHPEFQSWLNEGDLNLPDGTGVVWFSHGNIPNRVTGTDLVQQLITKTTSIGCVIDPRGLSTQAEIQRALPEAEIITVEETFHSQPKLILVALGNPAQEQWMIKHAKAANCRVMMGVGSSLDHLTGKQQRAPLIFQRLRLEWLWRLCTQPQRFKRILTATITFPYLVLTTPDSSNTPSHD